MTADTDEQSPSPLSVLLVVDDDVFNRLGSAVRHLCVGMMDEAVRLTVLSRSVQPAGEDAIGPARVISVPRARWPWTRPSAGELLERIGGDRPQVVHCLSARLARWAQRWSAEFKSVLLVHLTDLEDVRQFRRLRTGGRTTAIATTASIERTLLKKCPDVQGRLRVVALGIPAESEPSCLARPERVPAVVVTTPLTKNCGLGRVLRALQTIVKAGQEVQLFVLATGPAERWYRREVEGLGLRSHVTFAGRMRDWTALREAMRGADFYIDPSARRRFTIATLTAMASGLAVLAPSGTIGDYLIDGKTASLFDPLVPAQLAEKWAALLDDRSAARALGHGALDHVRVHHQASAMVNATARFYRELCGAQPAAAAVESSPQAGA